jgi:hypothetical protein
MRSIFIHIAKILILQMRMNRTRSMINRLFSFFNIDEFLKPKILASLVIAIIIRLFLAPLTEQRWDMYNWRLSQVFVYQYHMNPFSLPLSIPSVFSWSYTPFWLFILLLVFPIYNALSPLSYPQNPEMLWKRWGETSNMFEAYHSFVPPNLPLLDLLTKLPVIAADILIALVLYKMAKSYYSESNANYILLAWLFNPYSIWISSVWGMFDHIAILFVLLSLWFFLQKRYDASAICTFVGVSLKLYPALLIPVFAFIRYKESKKLKKAIRYFLISAGLSVTVLFLSYFISFILSGQEPLYSSVQNILYLIRGRASPDWMGQNIFYGLTPLFVLVVIFSKAGLGSANIPVSPILMLIGITILLLKLRSTENISREVVISYVVVTHFIIYMTYTVVNEQYMTWILPIMLLLALEKKSTALRYFYWILSGIAILYICIHYDLSYFISPHFSPGYLSIFIPPSDLLLVVAFLSLYVIGIKLVLKPKAKDVATPS